jgi:peptide/nickel transport system substrate-binding protein
VLTAIKPSRSFTMRRNPAWSDANSEAMPDLPEGHVETIEVKASANLTTQVNEVESGRLDWMKGPPPPDRLPELRRRYLDTQFREEPTISLFYFWMNTQEPPFDDPLVRRAVNYALDRDALERIYAGTIKSTEQVLPPPMPGFRRFEPYPHDLAKAKALIARADPSDRQVTVWTINFSPHDEAAQYYQQILRQLGFDAELKVIDGSNYFGVIGNQSTPDLDTGWGSWLIDYPHPNDYFEPQLAGRSILPTGSTNWARFDDPKINAEIAHLGSQPLDPAAYARLDREVMRRAPWAPFGNFTNSTFVSDAIDLDAVVYSPIFGQDLTSFEFK